MNYKEKYVEWLTSDLVNNETKEELRSIANNNEEIENRFYKDLEFGTGGMRGIIGAGTNMLNKYTVMKATQGLANYINQYEKQFSNKLVMIAYDSRKYSKEFSEAAALCLNANGIQTYLFDGPRPTPVLSYAMREFESIAGIVITASHNPKEYNGYKLYWQGGGQITPPMDKQIIEEVKAVKQISDSKTIELKIAKEQGLYHTLSSDIDEQYNRALLELALNKNELNTAKDLTIVFSPLHGVGGAAVERVLKDLGAHNYYIVPEQAEPNGDFPTIHTPNPEEKEAFELSLKLAKEKNADIILTTDADADRVGLYVKDRIKNAYVPFNGNMSAIIAADYILAQRKEKETLPKNGMLISTIVSSKMGKTLADAYGIQYQETLTGFKYIGELMSEYHQTGEFEFLFGFEESYGFLNGQHVRDKDGIAAVSLLSEIAAYYKNRGITLVEQLQNIYEKHGYSMESAFSMTLKGKSGAEKIDYILKTLRELNLHSIGLYTVMKVRDYREGTIKDQLTEELSPLISVKSNVLYFELDNDAWFCVRPSGTEPKIKLYFGVNEKENTAAFEKQEVLKKCIQNLIKEINNSYETGKGMSNEKHLQNFI